MPPPLKKVKVYKSTNRIGTVKAAQEGTEGREGFVLGKEQKKGPLPEFAKAFRKGQNHRLRSPRALLTVSREARQGN